MKDDDHLYLDAAQLAERGWTETLIKRFLGAPDRWKAVDHWKNWTGKRTYFLDRVRFAESFSDFEEAFSRSIRRRKVSREQLDRYLEERAKTKDAVCAWRDSLTDEDKRTMEALQKVADIFKEARRRGYRTPHK